MNQRTGLIGMIIAITLFGCSRTAVTESTSSSVEADQATSSSAQTVTTLRTCLAEPEAKGDRQDAGEVVDLFSGYAEVDCQEVFGGEVIQMQAVLATDEEGVVRFGLDLADADCRLAPRSILHLLPSADTAFYVSNGVLICTFFGGAANDVEVKTGETLATADIGERTVAMFVFEDGDTRVIVIEGFVVVDPAGTACRSIIGPTEEIEIRPGGSLTIQQIDVGRIPDLWRSSFSLNEAMLNPAPGPELLPGLSDFLEDNEVTFVLDGKLLSETPAVQEYLPILETVTAAELEVEPTGQITVVEPIEAAPPPVIEMPMESPAIDPIFSVVAIDPNLLAEALDQTTTVDPAVKELFIDPDGHRWSLAYDASDTALESAIAAGLRDQLRSGAFGAFYRSQFGVGPDYDVMVPERMEGAESCRTP